MRKYLIGFFLFFHFVVVRAQSDSINIRLTMEEDLRSVHIEQEISYTNRLNVAISKIKLLNWIAAYKNKSSALAKRKLEDEKKALYFAKKDQLGELKELEIEGKTYDGDLGRENLYIDLPKELPAGEHIKFHLHYTLYLPLSKFTDYGYDNEKKDKVAFKYFFIVPDFFEDEQQSPRYYLDIEESESPSLFWNVDFNVPLLYSVESNLVSSGDHNFSGVLNVDPEFLIQSIDNKETFAAQVDEKKTKVVLGYALQDSEREYLKELIPHQLDFIYQKTGIVPPKIFISEKFRDDNKFIGIDDIKFWKFHFRFFPEKERLDMMYYSILSSAVIQNSFISEKNADHWIKNGLQTGLEMHYINQFYGDKKLLGDLPEQIRLWKFKPITIFHARKVDLKDRYGLFYQYVSTKNLDQKVGELYQNLSRTNQKAVSQFEMGMLFNFVSQKMGPSNFATFLRTYFKEHQNKRIDGQDFLKALEASSNGSTEFLKDYIAHRTHVNFDVKRVLKDKEGYSVRLKKNTELPIPVQVNITAKNGERNYWLDTKRKELKDTYTIPSSEIVKVSVNNNYLFPETDYRDNYVYNNSFFANRKKIKLRFINDIPDPEYREIYITPKVDFNAYDRVLIGVNFHNKALFAFPFTYSISPYYSTATSQFKGSASFAYDFKPAEAFFRNWVIGASASTFHYDYDLAYKKFTVYSDINFQKHPRSLVHRSLNMSYNYFQKELSPEMIAKNDYDKYHLWSFSYAYSKNLTVKEISFGTNYQFAENFQKIAMEGFFRWEFAPKKKLAVRLYGGYFINNETRNDFFDYGISKLSNYAFTYGLIGQSSDTGIFSQQFILAEGGFKSLFEATVNQWIVSTNIDTHVWKLFNLYADAGVYKNRYQKPTFIWDSGIKVKVIPDFLEIYFPIQSSLGFEPALDKYFSRIRYTLKFNLKSITNLFNLSSG